PLFNELPSLRYLANYLVMKDQAEVCPLARGVMWPITAAQLLSTSLQDGLRFLRLPIPALLSARLTVCFPLQITRGRIRAYHVPRERQSRLGPAALPVARRLRQMTLEHLIFTPVLSGPACRHFSLVSIWS